MKWIERKIGDLSELVRGVSYKRDDASMTPRDGYIKILRANNINNDCLNEDELVYVPKKLVSSEQLIRKGDIIVAMSSGSKHLVGKSAVSLSSETRSFGAFCGLIRPKGIFPNLLANFLNSQEFRRYISEVSAGSNINNLKREHILDFKIRFPEDEASQKKLSDRINALFAEIQYGAEELHKAKKQLDLYKQAILNSAIQGRLVPQDSKDEPAAKLLERIRDEKDKLIKEKTLKVEKPLPLINPNEAPFELPKGWEWVQLSELCLKITDGEHFRPKTTDSGVYFLSAKDVRENGVSFEDPLFIDSATAKKARQRCDPERGDILIVSRGATVGRNCIVETDEVFCLLGSVILLKLTKQIEPKLLQLFINSEHYRRALFGLSGSTAQQAIYLRDIKNIVFPFPPFEEQRRIINEAQNKLFEMELSILELKNQISKINLFKQSVLKSAFEGKLL